MHFSMHMLILKFADLPMLKNGKFLSPQTLKKKQKKGDFSRGLFGAAELQAFGRWGQGLGFESREARTPAALPTGARRQGIKGQVKIVTIFTSLVVDVDCLR